MSEMPNTSSQPSFPEMYERWLVGPLFRPWVDVVLDEVGISRGDRLVDIACGTGIVARVAKERLGAGAKLVGIDISADMLAVARTIAPEIDSRLGNAGSLPLGAGEQFDVVVCHQGFQFFPDKPAAAAEMRRAMARGGRLGVATWRSDEEMPLVRDLRQVAERSLGPIADARYGMGDAEPLVKLLQDAGFQGVRTRKLSRTIGFDDGEKFVQLNTMALVGMSAKGKEMTAEDRNRVLKHIAGESLPVMRRYAHGAAIEVSTNLVTARG